MQKFNVFVDFKKPLDKNKAHGLLLRADNPVGTLEAESKEEAYKEIHEVMKEFKMPECELFEGMFYELRLEETKND